MKLISGGKIIFNKLIQHNVKCLVIFRRCCDAFNRLL